MVGSLPVPIQFELPEGWQAVDPDKVGASDAAFVAVNWRMNYPGFTANIAIDGFQESGDVSLADLAEDSVQNLHTASLSVSVSERSEFGSRESPGMMQVLRVATQIDSQRMDLIQCQVYVVMRDINMVEQKAIIRLTLTTGEDDFGGALPGFKKFVASIQPDT